MRATRACRRAVKTALVSSIDGMNAEVLRRLKGNSHVNIIASDAIENIQSGQLREAEVIFADPPTFAKTDYINKSETPKLRFFQSTFAGCDAMFKKDRTDYTLCRASGLWGRKCSICFDHIRYRAKVRFMQRKQIKAFWNHKSTLSLAQKKSQSASLVFRVT